MSSGSLGNTGNIIPASGPYPEVHKGPTGLGTWAAKQSYVPKSLFTLAQDWGTAKMYAAYASFDDMMDTFRNNPGHHLYELLLDNKATFLYFDIDRHDILYTPDDVAKALVCALKAYFTDTAAMDEAGTPLANFEFVEGDTLQLSNATRLNRTSIHVKISIGVRNRLDHARLVKTFTSWIAERKEDYPELVEFGDTIILDQRVYSNNRVMRALYQNKLNTTHPLKPLGRSSVRTEDHLILHRPGVNKKHMPWLKCPGRGVTVVNMSSTNTIAAAKQASEKTLPECRGVAKMLDQSSLEKHSTYFNSVQQVKDIMHGNVEVCRVTDLPGRKVVYTLKDARCPYKQDVHQGNHVYMSTFGNSQDISICCNDPACREIYGTRPVKILFDYAFEIALHDQAHQGSMHPQDKFITWNEVYNEQSMRPYPECGIVAVRANMGTGKTVALKQFVDIHTDATSKVLIVTFSRTLAAKLYADFSQDGSWTDYTKVKGDIRNQKVVVCLDSMHRVETRNFDYVFVDEALSVFLHFNSPLMLRSSQNCAYLELLIRQSRCTFFVDACIDQTLTTQIINYFSQVTGKPAYWIKNTHVRNPGSRSCKIKLQRGGGTLAEMALMTDAVTKVVQLLDSGKKVVVCSSTKRFTTTLEEYITVNKPDITMVVCNGDKPNNFEDVNRSWKRDLLIYSPSVSAGVSFEETHFDSLVGYIVNSNFTPSVDISLQQLYRVRNLSDMTLFVQDCMPNYSDLPTSDSEVDEMLIGSMSIINKYYLSSQLASMAHQIVDNDRIKFDTSRLSYIIIKGIIAMRHRSLKYYTDILCTTLEQDYGVKCTVSEVEFDSDKFEGLQGLEEASKKMRCVDYLDVRHLAQEPTGDQEYKLIRETIQEGREVPDTDIAAMKLYDATRRWEVDQATVDEDFYKKYVLAGNNALYKARNFVSVMLHTVDEVQKEMTNHIRKIATISLYSEVKDKNLDIYKSRVTQEYGRLIICYKWLDRCLTCDQKEDLKSLETITVNATDMDRTFRELKRSMNDGERTQMYKLFDMSEGTSDFIAFKKILDRTLGLDVSRQNARKDRKGYRLINVKPGLFKHMLTKYNSQLVSFAQDELEGATQC